MIRIYVPLGLMLSAVTCAVGCGLAADAHRPGLAWALGLSSAMWLFFVFAFQPEEPR